MTWTSRPSRSCLRRWPPWLSAVPPASRWPWLARYVLAQTPPPNLIPARIDPEISKNGNQQTLASLWTDENAGSEFPLDGSVWTCFAHSLALLLSSAAPHSTGWAKFACKYFGHFALCGCSSTSPSPVAGLFLFAVSLFSFNSWLLHISVKACVYDKIAKLQLGHIEKRES